MTQKIKYLFNKIPSTAGLVSTAALNTKVTEIKNEIPHISCLFNKTDCDARIKEIDDRYNTTSEFNKFWSKIFDDELKGEKLATNIDLNIVSKLTNNES